MAKPNTYVQKLRRLLRGTPLAPYARLIARTEARYKIPAGTIAGIAKAETGLGTAGAGPGMNNFWGWMTGAGPPNQRSFANPAQAIRQYGKFLSSNYTSKGLRTPQQIMNRYVGSNSPTWLSNVTSITSQFGGAPPSTVPGTTTPTTPRTTTGTTSLFAQPGKGDKKMLFLGLAMMSMNSRDSDTSNISMLSTLLPLLMNYGPGKGRDINSTRNAVPVNPTSVGKIVGGHGLRLPVTFTSDHNTDGLGGYPAKDWKASAGTPVGSPMDGTIIKISGSNTWKQGGIGGRSVYVQRADGRVYFLTHFAPNLQVRVGQRVRRNQILGYVGRPTSGMMQHIHEGLSSRAYAPGQWS